MPTTQIFSLILVVWLHLDKKRRKQIYLILALTILSVFSEVISLGALLPFLSVLLSPEKLLKIEAINKLASFFNFSSPKEIVLPCTLFFIFSILFSAALRLIQLKISTKVIFSCGSDLSLKIYRSVLNQSYSQHLLTNSSEVISGVGKVDVAVNVLSQILTLTSTLFFLIVVLVSLFFINFFVSLIVFSCFISCYLIVNFLFQIKVKKNSKFISKEKISLVRILQEGFGGIRNVILDGTQHFYWNVYHQGDQLLRAAEASNAFIGASPKYIMESFGMVSIAVLFYVLSVYFDAFEKSIPLLGVFVFSVQRLLPALQQAYNSWTAIIGHYASLSDVVSLLESSKGVTLNEEKANSLVFNDSIELKNIFFRYSEDTEWILDNICVKISKGSRIGIVGQTGSGKSTFLDVFMGLLRPSSGQFLVDGVHITDQLVRDWQKNVSHVPQSIYLSEGSLIENIAFGISPSLIDMDRIKKAAKKAQIEQFIESISEKYNTLVGERGIRLSGGQRQRIGIARALYKDSKLIVFDEATSALDNETEQLVMDSIENLDREKTVLLIAHRLTTVRGCDLIFVFNNGKIIAQGTYEQLIDTCDFFKKI